ncbi:MAG: hypothetical protein ACI8ZX_001776 [Planctomycetota bacterium]|jgi:hypothetical protein
MRAFNIFIILSITIIACQKEARIAIAIPDQIVPNDLRLNEIQVLGSHNSYRLKPDNDILEVLETLQGVLPNSFNIEELDYSHLTLKDQFEKHGIRQIELDLYQDPTGGLFYNRIGYQFVGKSIQSNEQKLAEPGIKVMHIPDIDFNTHYLTFIESLQAVKDFSLDFPYHLPITIMLEMKTETIADYLPGVGFAEAIPWDQASFDNMEAEILAIFSRDQIIKPDDIRNNANTLKEGLQLNGWPTIENSRGKVMFVFTNSASQNSIYKQGAPSLENKLCFTNANPAEDDAAFLIYNDPFINFDEIKEKVAEGFLIRTRSDAGTYQARSADYKTWTKAKNSGAQFISTDYYIPDERYLSSADWTDYSVGFDNGIYQLNPILE